MSVTGFPPPDRSELVRERRPSWPAFRLAPCCGANDLIRLHRPPLVRWLFPMKQLYLCPHCGSRVFYKR